MTASKNTQRTPISAKENATTGKGMPAKTPKAGGAQVGKASTPHDASVESSLSLPHERDQSTNMTSDKPSPKIQQAGEDVKSRRQDTSKSPEMNAAYQKLK